MINRELVFQKFKGRCAYCGCDLELDNFNVDHIVPIRTFRNHREFYRASGFKLDHIDNLNPSCFSCNNYKQTFTVNEFRNQISLQIDRLRRDKPTFRLAERYELIECIKKDIVFYFETFKNGY